jgi:hypothetical protein
LNTESFSEVTQAQKARLTMTMTTVRLLVLFACVASSLLTCYGTFLNDMPEKGCSLCNDGEVLNVDMTLVGSSKTCQDIDEEARESSLENSDNFLSPCFNYQERYKEQCCVNSSIESGASVILQSGANEHVAENSAHVFSASQQKNMFGESQQELESESSVRIVDIFGVRREDPWSGAAKSWLIGYFSLVVSVLAFLPTHFL